MIESNLHLFLEENLDFSSFGTTFLTFSHSEYNPKLGIIVFRFLMKKGFNVDIELIASQKTIGILFFPKTHPEPLRYEISRLIHYIKSVLITYPPFRLRYLMNQLPVKIDEYAIKDFAHYEENCGFLWQADRKKNLMKWHQECVEISDTNAQADHTFAKLVLIGKEGRMLAELLQELSLASWEERHQNRYAVHFHAEPLERKFRVQQFAAHLKQYQYSYFLT